MALSDETLARLRTKVGKMFKEEVPETPELHRILDLPRRVWENAPNLDAFTLEVSRYLKTPQGTQTLRPLQAKALQELHDFGGLFGPIPVGEGKTLVSFLAPVVLECKRPLLIVPAKLRDKTLREFEALKHHWKRNPGLQIVSYEKLSRENGTKFLQNYQPDLLILDEAHRLKNKNAAVTRKISAWIRTFPETRVVVMSGTITKRSLLDFAHLLRWCLPPDRCPLPQPVSELEAWAAAVDEIKNYESRVPTGPGALIVMCDIKEKQAGRDGVRSAVRRRLQETAGVLATNAQSVATSLNIQLVLETGYNTQIRQLAEQLNEGTLPNGDVFIEEGKEGSTAALNARWRIMRTLTSGFWYDWDPKPPPDWLELRASWKKAVRKLLEAHLPGLESEALVAKAAANKKLGWSAYELYLEWAKVRDKHKWNVVPVWEDDSIIQRVAKWSKDHHGLIWVSEVALGDRLERELGLPYFRQMGQNKQGLPVESAESKNGSIVVSVASNSEGRNLQHEWSDNLVISPPPTGTVWEQIIGRTHRPGQEADEVWFEVVIGCRVEWECWQQALRDAKYASQVEGPKKISLATIDVDFKVPGFDGGLW